MILFGVQNGELKLGSTNLYNELENHHAIDWKFTIISMAIFRSYVSLPEGRFLQINGDWTAKTEINRKLVGGFNSSETYESQLGYSSPAYR